MLMNTTDRRARRTERLLKQGFCELLEEKEISTITSKDITSRMDLNRGTFYHHYSNVKKLRESLETDVLREMSQRIDRQWRENDSCSVIGAFRALADYIFENQKLCTALLGDAVDQRFGEGICKILKHCCIRAACAQSHDVAENSGSSLYYIFVGCGLFGLLTNWVKTDLSLSREILFEIVQILLRKFSLS